MKNLKKPLTKGDMYFFYFMLCSLIIQITWLQIIAIILAIIVLVTNQYDQSN